MTRPHIKAEDIGSFDVTPSWERPEPDPAVEASPFGSELGCGCGLCQLARGGHL